MKDENAFEQQLFSITTIIESTVTINGREYSFQGSGFYYTEQSPTEESISVPQYYSLDKFWLVTNRHVIVAEIDGKEYLPDLFTFCFRENVDGEIR